MIRTGIAILCGFLAMAIVVMLGTAAATTAFVTATIESLSQPNPPLPVSYLVANLAISLLAAIAGGWIASRLDPAGGWRPVIGLTLLVLLMSVTNQAVPRSGGGQPVPWYPWAVSALGVVGSLLGGRLRIGSRPMSASGSVSVPPT